MSQNTDNCSCNDYALLTANTGVASIDSANSSMTGVGATLVITGGGKGTIVKSIIIKNADGGTSLLTNPLRTGMVRLFIDDGTNRTLYREIPIPTYPSFSAVPYPVPIWPLLEIDLMPELKLEDGYSLYASTQNANTFNIIAQGVSYRYPGNKPTVCCNLKQETVINGLGTVSVANSNVDGSGDIVDLYTVSSGANGAVIKSITVAALGSTLPGMVRFYISPDGGTTYYLWMESYIPESTQSAFTPSLKRLLQEEFYLEADYIISASTQNPESFAITVEGEEWIYAS